MPSSAGYTYHFSTDGIRVLGRFEAPGGIKYVRLPGNVRFKNLHEEIDVIAVQNPRDATLAKYWTAALFMDNSVYEYYKKKINDWYNESPSTRGAFPRFPDPSTNKDQYFIYLNL